MKEFNQTKINKRMENILNTKKFSGVDNKLKEVYQYLDLIGRNKVEANLLLSKGNSFDDIQDFVINQAKALQICSSKAIGTFIFLIFSF